MNRFDRLLEKHNIEWAISTSSSFYFILNSPAKFGEIIVAYNNNVVVGAVEWTGPYSVLAVMGYDGNEITNGYCMVNDVPTFKLIDRSGKVINLTGSIPSFIHHNFPMIKLYSKSLKNKKTRR